MTSAPSHPPVHAYSPGKNPMELVQTSSGNKMERWRADALLVGETSALTELSKQVRSEATETITDIEAREAALNARDDAISARERQHAVSVAQFVDFVGKASVLFDKLQKARDDAIAAEREPLAHPPGHPGDPSDPSKLPEPSLALENDTPAPDGSLHVIPAQEDPDIEGDNRGEFLRLKHPVTTDTDAEFVDPKLPRPPTEFQQPIAAELDEDN
jgi:hypothetical protein